MTTTFKIDLMEFAIGMNRLISHRTTPTTISVNNTWTKGMIFHLTSLHALLMDWWHDRDIAERKMFTSEHLFQFGYGNSAELFDAFGAYGLAV